MVGDFSLGILVEALLRLIGGLTISPKRAGRVAWTVGLAAVYDGITLLFTISTYLRLFLFYLVHKDEIRSSLKGTGRLLEVSCSSQKYFDFLVRSDRKWKSQVLSLLQGDVEVHSTELQVFNRKPAVLVRFYIQHRASFHRMADFRT
ncbi:UNVERIFIED_CONTAM: hypothetical protein HHA_235940 [Hammondia hammondi]|eukprot:XP_008885515.1 hypothetical protein HHA_235940 [Hammondia hammondi]